MNRSLNDQYERDGYVALRQVITPSEVATLRKWLLERLQEHGQPRFLKPGQCLELPVLCELPFRARVVDALRQLVGDDYRQIGDLHVHHNIYGIWHTEAGPDGRRRYQLDPGFRVVKCGMYLQDNDGRGGGLTVLRGGHRFPFRAPGVRLPFHSKALRDAILRVRGATRLDLAAGDLLLFDFQLPHVATRPLPSHRCHEHKLAIFFNAARRDSVRPFLKQTERRALSEETVGGEVYFSDFLHRRFPQDYPASYARCARAAGVTVATPNPGDADHWRSWNDRMCASASRAG